MTLRITGVYELCPSSGILKTLTYNVFETEFVSAFRLGEEATYSAGTLTADL
jgi:hypothetical protein